MDLLQSFETAKGSFACKNGTLDLKFCRLKDVFTDRIFQRFAINKMWNAAYFVE